MSDPGRSGRWGAEPFCGAGSAFGAKAVELDRAADSKVGAFEPRNCGRAAPGAAAPTALRNAAPSPWRRIGLAVDWAVK